MTKDLEARIRVLEDIEEIKKLKARYCELCDAGLTDVRNRDELVAHFTEDAKVDFGMGEGSSFEGKAGLELFFGQVVPAGVSFCMHMLHNPIIDVNGDRASGRWYFEAPTTNAVTGKPQWMAGRYLEEYVRVDGVWKFASVATEWKYIAPYEDGWSGASGDVRKQAEGG